MDLLSSSYALEVATRKVATPSLAVHGIKILPRKELGFLLNQDKIVNQEPDMEWLRKQVKLNIFDTYLALSENEKFKVYGGVQTRTSISDSGIEDRRESILSMKKFFMSVSIVLDGNNLENPIIKNLVNGCEFDNQINGWHGVYVLSNKEIDIDRIHSIDVSLENFVRDVIEGAKFWTEQRQWFNHTWKPKR